MKLLDIEPKGTSFIHFQLAAAFENWLLNDGYQAKPIKHAAVVRYSMANKETLEIYSTGKMNEAAQKRYSLFLKQYLRLGKSMIASLKGQSPKMLKVA
ncbi:hypothetical protein B9T25_13120 [Acinetobacter sp. ANC 4470]|uniref:hypothetical protein n=1 Tax=Acinetobacter sp. ANC 4470 TaxID=1977881 RepID=UPI000A32BCB7|nr:hypothetical protein [Acinetobacter sp. ANC 4470]OTG64376.1 hypothetical protein B9T25_13120 [Acinetobacter sp. ANC 4470]